MADDMSALSQHQIWQPRYTLTPAAVRALLEIEAARAVVDHTPFPPMVVEELRRRARIRSTHYSTRIEGNRLTLAEAEEVLSGSRTRFHGRERDVSEVRNYWNALLRVEEWAARGTPLTEELIQRLHALVEHGPRAKPTPYRQGQNAIRDSETGALVYLPPEQQDVPALMAGLVSWVGREWDILPVPVIAGLAHYQFVTIHPYFDGNGRTARLLATFLLHRGGYGLNGFFSLEEYHARDLAAYYGSLVTHPHHNYYEGRAEADLTPWLEYFLQILATVFGVARKEALQAAGEGFVAEPEMLRRLDPRARAVLGLFAHQDRISARDIAATLGLSERMARELLRNWVQEGFLEVMNASRRGRAYTLSAVYRQFIGGLSAMTSHLFVYGTLMSGGENHRLLARRAELVGRGRMRGRLFVVDYFPGLVDSDDPTETVVGEVWRLLAPEILRGLDEFEGCLLEPPLFIRASRTVAVDGDGALAAWVYLYARSTAGLRPIPSGDWRLL